MAYGDVDAGMTKAEKQHLGNLEATCVKLRKAVEAVLDAEDTLINTKDQKYTPQLKALCKACDGLAKVIGEEKD